MDYLVCLTLLCFAHIFCLQSCNTRLLLLDGLFLFLGIFIQMKGYFLRFRIFDIGYSFLLVFSLWNLNVMDKGKVLMRMKRQGYHVIIENGAACHAWLQCSVFEQIHSAVILLFICLSYACLLFKRLFKETLVERYSID